MGGESAQANYGVCIGPNLTCMNDMMNRMGQYDHVEYQGRVCNHGAGLEPLNPPRSALLGMRTGSRDLGGFYIQIFPGFSGSGFFPVLINLKSVQIVKVK